MSVELNFEAEPFTFEADYESARLRRRYARWPPPADQEFEVAPAAGAPQCVPATLKTPKPPGGLVLLPHLHNRKALPTGNASGVPQCMDVAGMNPGFVDPVTDVLVTSPSATGLHARLRALIESKYKQHAQKIGVALVDLTGPRLFAPDFAGWRSPWPVYGASLPKICALYPAHQLGYELKAFADHLKLTTKQALVTHVRGLWEKAGLARSQQPNLDDLFDYAEAPPRPVAVKPSAKLEKLISCTFKSNCNWAASLLIDRVGLAYIGSVLWQSGLFHPKRGGLWVKGLYGLSCGCAADCCFSPNRVEKALKPVYVTPSASGSHNASALSAVTYFTLMAQGRLADDASSLRVRNSLEPACSLFGGDQLTCHRFRMPTKCGIVTGIFHDVALVERNVGPGCTGKVIRYAVALLTSGVASSSGRAVPLFKQFLSDADTLIQQNNP